MEPDNESWLFEIGFGAGKRGGSISLEGKGRAEQARRHGRVEMLSARLFKLVTLTGYYIL